MSQPGYEPSPDQVVHERAMGAVFDVLLNIEGTLAHATRAKATVEKDLGKDGGNLNASLALGEAVRDLERLRKRLMQDTYFAVDTRLV